MISLLVSSKTMVAQPTPDGLSITDPKLLEQAEIVSKDLRKLSVTKIQKLMHISQRLASQTHRNIDSWSSRESHPAWYLFSGDVYKGLKVNEFTTDDLYFAQDHIATLSGLYGLVRPLDRIKPYRLELGHKLTGKEYRNLYEFWGNQVAAALPKNEPIINLASEEYIKVIRPFVEKDLILTPWFVQTKNNIPDFQAIHAKIARGTMARWIAKNRINEPSDLLRFDLNGYKYNAKLSNKTRPTFIRKEGYDFRSDY